MKSRIQIINETLFHIIEGAKETKERAKARQWNANFYLQGKGPRPTNPEQAEQVMNIIGMVIRNSQARREEAQKLRAMRRGEIKSGGVSTTVKPEVGKKLAQEYLSRVRY